MIGVTSLTDFFTWIDAAYAVYSDMRSHTGGNMSMGVGVLHTKSGVQKLNTKKFYRSRTSRSEQVFTVQYLDNEFYACTRLKIKNNILYQDNQSVMCIEQNGRNSSTGNSRHTDIRYFFVADRVKKKDISVQYCPIEIMLAGFFTKLLQGALFRKFRDIIMGYKPITTLSFPREDIERIRI